MSLSCMKHLVGNMKIDVTKNELESLLSLVKLSIWSSKECYKHSNSVNDLECIVKQQSLEIKLYEALNGIR